MHDTLSTKQQVTTGTGHTDKDRSKMSEESKGADSGAPARSQPSMGRRSQSTPSSSSSLEGRKTVRRSVSTTSDAQSISYEPSISIAVFLTWVLPVLVIAGLTRFAVDKEAEFVGLGMGRRGSGGSTSSSRPITVDLSKEDKPTTTLSSSVPTSPPAATPTTSTPKRRGMEPTSLPTYLSNKPTGYVDVVQAIGRRRLDWSTTDSSSVGGSPSSSSARPPASSPTMPSPSMSDSSPTSSSSRPTLKEPPRGASSDPVRTEMMEKIERLRQEYEADTSDLYKLLELADLLRLHDVQYHDGGSLQEETIQRYRKAIDLGTERKQKLIEAGEETNRNSRGTVDVNEEITLNYTERSIDGILCAVYTALGKTYFMANMFERAVASYSQALEIEPLYLDAVSSRGSARIILGQYEGAAIDFTTTMENDSAGRFFDVFTGLARVLQARESSVPQGWTPMIDTLHAMIPTLEIQYENLASAAMDGNPSAKTGTKMLANTLNRLYHVLFLYHDVKTNDTDAAWNALTKAYKFKMSALPSWNTGFENQKIASTKQIFHQGFWPEGVGSSSAVPIFIIGFVRSGSTLLERILDAHPQIVGTGENSVFNGRLDSIRNKIVEASLSSDADALKNVISTLADGVVDEMKQRWKMVAADEERAADEPDAERYVDKMLTNYYNVGFIHMLFPNALILHVAREPMDTIFSAYKHEFPSGTLDYTSQFDSLAELYHAYRDLIEHWDRVLPGRVTHVRYEDMVHDMPNIARKIVEATGLDWDDSVLDFHKKKQAVNTLSTTQVRKGIYKDSLQAWRRYENHLAPLVEIIGPRTDYDLKTSLKGYTAPDPDDEMIEDKEEEEEEVHTSSEKYVQVGDNVDHYESNGASTTEEIVEESEPLQENANVDPSEEDHEDHEATAGNAEEQFEAVDQIVEEQEQQQEESVQHNVEESVAQEDSADDHAREEQEEEVPRMQDEL